MKTRSDQSRSGSARVVRVRRAFTLLELMVALTMVAILAGVLGAALKVAFRARASSEAAVEPARTADMAMEFLRLDIENAIPQGDVLAGSFQGTDGRDERGHDGDDLLFYTTAPSPDHVSANGEIKEVELLLTTAADTGEHVLVRRVTRNLLASIQPEPDEQVICRGVNAFGLRYYDGFDWVDDWSSSEQDGALPLAVEATVELERPDGVGGPMKTIRYVRIFSISCSTAGQQTTDATNTQ